MENSSSILGCSMVIVIGIASFLLIRKFRLQAQVAKQAEEAEYQGRVVAPQKKLVLPESHLKKHDLHRQDAYKDFFSATKQARDLAAALGPADGVRIPAPITLSDLFHAPSAQACFVERLRERGYATLRLRDHWTERRVLFAGNADEDSPLGMLPRETVYRIVYFMSLLEDIMTETSTRRAYDNFYTTALKFFDLSREEKQKHADEHGNNLGFVHVEKVREYIKLRPTDEEHYWPTYEGFKDHFNAYFKSYHIIGTKAFQILAESPRLPNDVMLNRKDVDMTRLIPRDSYNAICEFLPLKSNISAIHYFPTAESEICDEHTDTGIFTIITRTHLPGLEMWDHKEGKYLKIEELLAENELVIFMGEKVPLFTCSSNYHATYHRVRIPPNLFQTRYSFAFLLDVAK